MKSCSVQKPFKSLALADVKHLWRLLSNTSRFALETNDTKHFSPFVLLTVWISRDCVIYVFFSQILPSQTLLFKTYFCFFELLFAFFALTSEVGPGGRGSSHIWAKPSSQDAPFHFTLALRHTLDPLRGKYNKLTVKKKKRHASLQHSKEESFDMSYLGLRKKNVLKIDEFSEKGLVYSSLFRKTVLPRVFGHTIFNFIQLFAVDNCRPCDLWHVIGKKNRAFTRWVFMAK